MSKRPSLGNMSCLALVLGWAATMPSAAHADPLTIPGYTVTDLGSGTPTFSTDANGNGMLNAPNGQIYAFAQTPDTTLTPGQGIMANFPLSVSPPINDAFTYGNPANAFAYVQGAVMNANGIVAATEVYGVAGHWLESTAFAVQYNSNGSWGTPIALWSGNEQLGGTFPFARLVTSVNSLNQVLGWQSLDPSGNGQPIAALYNVHSQTVTNIAQLFYSAEPFPNSSVLYNNFQPIALDNVGQILLSATGFDSNRGTFTTNLLLTPDSFSSAPLEVPAPEPGTLVILLLAAVGFLAHRQCEPTMPIGMSKIE